MGKEMITNGSRSKREELPFRKCDRCGDPIAEQRAGGRWTRAYKKGVVSRLCGSCFSETHNEEGTWEGDE